MVTTFFAKSLNDFSLIMPNPVSANSEVSNNQIRQEITNFLIDADYDNMKLWNRGRNQLWQLAGSGDV